MPNTILSAMTNTPTSPFPLVTVNLQITFSPPVLQDLHTYWLRQRRGQVGVLGAALAETETTVVLSNFTTATMTGLQTTAVFGVGDVILIGDDPMVVSAINGADGTTTLTVVRGPEAFPADLMLPIQPTMTHSEGDPVWWLAHEDGWHMVQDLWIRPGAQSAIIALGKDSATLYSSTVGSIVAPPQ